MDNRGQRALWRIRGARLQAQALHRRRPQRNDIRGEGVMGEDDGARVACVKLYEARGETSVYIDAEIDEKGRVVIPGQAVARPHRGGVRSRADDATWIGTL